MSAMSTTKGKVYERLIASKLRAVFPSSEVRRSSQADRAGNSDVTVTGHPVLERLWLELHDARKPNPIVKLVQAERDCERADGIGSLWLLPVVVWHRIREQSHQVTTRLWVLDVLRECVVPSVHSERVVTMDLHDFLALLELAIRRSDLADNLDELPQCP